MMQLSWLVDLGECAKLVWIGMHEDFQESEHEYNTIIFFFQVYKLSTQSILSSGQNMQNSPVRTLNNSHKVLSHR